MKIVAIPTREGRVDAHFGHCEYYTLFSINNDEIMNEEVFEAPQGCGCKSNIASVLEEKGVKLMLAGNMGNGAVNVLTSSGIEVIRGCAGPVNQVIKEYISGRLVDNGLSCEQHEHQCEH